MTDRYYYRDMPSVAYYEAPLTAEFVRFVDDEVLPQITLTGYKQEEKREVVRHAVHLLIAKTLSGGVVADTRNTSAPGVRLRVGVWDAIKAAGFADDCKGSEVTRKVTRYSATDKLLSLRAEWKMQLMLDLDLARNTKRPDDPTPLALVYLHTGKLDPATGKVLDSADQRQPVSLLDYVARHAQPGPDGKPDPQAMRNGMAFLRDIEDKVEKINRSNLSHAWAAYHTDSTTGRRHVFQPNPCMRQIHVGEMFRAVRLYSWGELSGQNLSQDVRRTMQIDGEPVAELDFSGMVTRMLYHYKRTDPVGDVYRPDVVLPAYHRDTADVPYDRDAVRDFVKRATNICWNVGSRAAANSSVGRLLADHPRGKFLRTVVYDIEGSDPVDLVGRIMAAHPQLADRFFTGCGVDLMTTDGRIMFRILRAFADAGRPALGIHDAVVCRVSDVEFARETMTDAYFTHVLHEPVIVRKY